MVHRKDHSEKAESFHVVNTDGTKFQTHLLNVEQGLLTILLIPLLK